VVAAVVLIKVARREPEVLEAVETQAQPEEIILGLQEAPILVAEEVEVHFSPLLVMVALAVPVS
jgi:hypothetical protein